MSGPTQLVRCSFILSELAVTSSDRSSGSSHLFLEMYVFLTAHTSCSGGAPDMAAMTGGKFSAGLSGCLRNLILMTGEQPQTVDLQAYAATGFNVQQCSL